MGQILESIIKIITKKSNLYIYIFFFFYKLHDAQSCPTLHDPMDYTVHGIFQARILDWIAFPFSRRIFPTRGLNPGLPHSRQILYQLSHKVQEYGVGSLCPLQCISPTQESNWSLLHCRQILYQLNYQGSPISTQKKKKNQISNKNRSFFYQTFINLQLKLNNVFPQ